MLHQTVALGPPQSNVSVYGNQKSSIQIVNKDTKRRPASTSFALVNSKMICKLKDSQKTYELWALKIKSLSLTDFSSDFFNTNLAIPFSQKMKLSLSLLTNFRCIEWRLKDATDKGLLKSYLLYLELLCNSLGKKGKLRNFGLKGTNLLRNRKVVHIKAKTG